VAVRADLEAVCACPACRSKLAFGDQEARCAACGSVYPIEAGIPILLDTSVAAPRLEERWYAGARGAVPEGLRRAFEPYRHHLRPSLTYKSRHAAGVVARFAASFGPDQLVANIGAGETDYGPHVLNVEIAPGPGVDVVGVAERLPLRDGSCRGVILMAVLEHVQDAERTLTEARRVMAPSGRLLIDVPFIQGYHPSPSDYRRFTEQGLRAEVARHGFEVTDSGIAIGPSSAMAWVASEFLAMLVSGRSARAYRLAKLVTTWIALPIKFADVWLERHPMAYTIPSAVWLMARRTD
jgi:uncharacterized protein YbaR (Trm112 family)